MAECELLQRCSFIQGRINSTPATLEIFRDRYCKREFALCARFRVFRARGIESVPKALFPNQSEKAEAILKDPG